MIADKIALELFVDPQMLIYIHDIVINFISRFQILYILEYVKEGFCP